MKHLKKVSGRELPASAITLPILGEWSIRGIIGSIIGLAKAGFEEAVEDNYPHPVE